MGESFLFSNKVQHHWQNQSTSTFHFCQIDDGRCVKMEEGSPAAEKQLDGDETVHIIQLAFFGPS